MLGSHDGIFSRLSAVLGTSVLAVFIAAKTHMWRTLRFPFLR